MRLAFISVAMVGYGLASVASAEEYSSCAAAKEANPNAPSGPQSIKIRGSDVTRELYCDMNDDGGGWTLVSVITSDSKKDCDKYV